MAGRPSGENKPEEQPCSLNLKRLFVTDKRREQNRTL